MTETLIQRWLKRPHFTCPECNRTSWNLSDIGNQYCGHCHKFFGPGHVQRHLERVFRETPRQPPLRRPRIVETAPRRREADTRRRDDDTPSPFQTPAWDATADPSPPAPPDPPSFDPGGGSSGGGGASGDF